jgi:hypothetical protein
MKQTKQMLAVYGCKLTPQRMKQIAGGLPNIVPYGSWVCDLDVGQYNNTCHLTLAKCESKCPLANYCVERLCLASMDIPLQDSSPWPWD